MDEKCFTFCPKTLPPNMKRIAVIKIVICFIVLFLSVLDLAAFSRKYLKYRPSRIAAGKDTWLMELTKKKWEEIKADHTIASCSLVHFKSLKIFRTSTNLLGQEEFIGINDKPGLRYSYVRWNILQNQFGTLLNWILIIQPNQPDLRFTQKKVHSKICFQMKSQLKTN